MLIIISIIWNDVKVTQRRKQVWVSLTLDGIHWLNIGHLQELLRNAFLFWSKLQSVDLESVMVITWDPLRRLPNL